MSILGYHPPSFISLKPSSSTWDLWEMGPWDCTPQAYSCSLMGDNGHLCPSVQRVLEVLESRGCPADLKDLVVPSYHNQVDQEHLRGMEGMRKKLQYDSRIKLAKLPPFLKNWPGAPGGPLSPISPIPLSPFSPFTPGVPGDTYESINVEDWANGTLDRCRKH